MRRLIVFILTLYLMLNSTFYLKGDILTVEASPSIYQGNLILGGNNVTVIEGEFNINGSIIIEENATLILRNGTVNFTQASDRQNNLTLTNSLNGNPRLIASNVTLTSQYEFPIYLNQNGTADFSSSTLQKMTTFQADGSIINMYNSTSDYTHWLYSSSSLSISNSTVGEMMIYDSPTVPIFNSTVNSLNIAPSSVDCTISKLKPDLFSRWNFISNCSVNILPSGTAPNVTLIDTNVNHWRFGVYGNSTMTVADSTINDFSVFGSTFLRVSDSSIGSYIYARDSAVVLLINSTYQYVMGIDDSASIDVAWHLDVHAVDSNGADVPSASVTATYQNGTLAQSEVTDLNGWARMVLNEITMNHTGEYPIGNYTVEAAYETHLNSATVNMTENMQTTLSLPFVIPELQPFLVVPLFLFATSFAVIVYRRKRTVQRGARAKSRKSWHILILE